jgi:hypothetical protein
MLSWPVLKTTLLQSPADSVKVSEIPSEEPVKLRNSDLGFTSLERCLARFSSPLTSDVKSTLWASYLQGCWKGEVMLLHISAPHPHVKLHVNTADKLRSSHVHLKCK